MHLEPPKRGMSAYHYALYCYKAVRGLLAIRGDNKHIAVVPTGSSFIIKLISALGGGIDMSKFICGYTSLTKISVHVNQAMVRDNGETYQCGGEDLAISSTALVQLRYIRGQTVEYVNPVPSTLLESSPTVIYIPLYSLTNGALGSIYGLGVQIP